MSPAKEIIVINPNSNEHVTSSMNTALEPLRLTNGPIIRSVTNVDGPSGIESQQDADTAALQVVDIIKRNNSADAFVIACFSDPGIFAAREVTSKPVFGIAETVVQRLIYTEQRNKRLILRELLANEEVSNAVIFCNRKRDIGILYRSLLKHGFNAAELHGDLPQSSRTSTLNKFKSGDIQLLIASDVAARGLDIADLSHVVNFDVPSNAEDYVHRIGRTGRAGKKGKAFTLVTSDDEKYIEAITALIKKPIETLKDYKEQDTSPTSIDKQLRTP